MTDSAFIILLGVLLAMFVFMALLTTLVLRLQKLLGEAVEAIRQIASASAASSNSTNLLIEDHRKEMRHHFQLLNARAGFPNE